MSESKIKTVSKNDLKNVRELIEIEINRYSASPLYLTDVISVDKSINNPNTNLFFEENLNLLIKNKIKNTITNHLQSWLKKNISEIISPIIKDYLNSSGQKTSNQQKQSVNKKIKKEKIIVSNDKEFNEMSLNELRSEVLKKGIKLDKRNSKKTLISLLLKN
jgi:predicted HTH domain antitoxin